MPVFKRKECPCGVYKITFNDKWFYIGSSVNLKRRFSSWKSKIVNSHLLSNKNISIILPSVKCIRFEIIFYYDDEQTARNQESELLKKDWDNPLLLNRCPETEYGVGVANLKKYIGYQKPVKPISTYVAPSKKIARFDLNGVLLEIHPSKSELRRKLNNCSSRDLTKHLNGITKKLYGFQFKLVMEDGSFQERPSF